MSREIKFRAWIIKENKYLYWFEMYGLSRYDDNKLGVHVGIADQCYLDPEDIILEQYTGIKDINGIEIYENDKVKNSNGKIREVGFNEHRSQFGLYNRVFDCWITNELLSDGWEIIGNIHENKEIK